MATTTKHVSITKIDLKAIANSKSPEQAYMNAIKAEEARYQNLILVVMPKCDDKKVVLQLKGKSADVKDDVLAKIALDVFLPKEITATAREIAILRNNVVRKTTEHGQVYAQITM